MLWNRSLRQRDYFSRFSSFHCWSIGLLQELPWHPDPGPAGAKGNDNDNDDVNDDDDDDDDDVDLSALVVTL